MLDFVPASVSQSFTSFYSYQHTGSEKRDPEKFLDGNFLLYSSVGITNSIITVPKVVIITNYLRIPKLDLHQRGSSNIHKETATDKITEGQTIFG